MKLTTPHLFVTVKILECAAHPNAAKLKVCKVTDGLNQYQIVCGAANARQAMITILAKEGATLPSGLTIRKADLRGVESWGMLCSPQEIGLVSESGIIDLPPSTPVGKTISELNPHDISSTPWYEYKKVESFWIDGQKKIYRFSEPNKAALPNHSKLLSETYFYGGKYHYRAFH